MTFIIAGFLAVLVPAAIAFLIRERHTRRDQIERWRRSNDQREREKAYSVDFVALCERNGWPIPPSSEAFYADHPKASPSSPLDRKSP